MTCFEIDTQTCRDAGMQATTKKSNRPRDLLVAVLVNNVVNVRFVVHLVVVVDDTFHAHVLLRPVDLELLA